MAKINVTFNYNDDGPEGEQITKWLLNQGNVSAAIRRLILKKPLETDGVAELRDEVAQLREEMEELRKKVDGNA
jgi:hypothetical protein